MERGPAPPANANLTFDNGKAVICFEDQLWAPPGPPVVTQPPEEDELAPPQGTVRGAQEILLPEMEPPFIPPPGNIEPPYSGIDSALKSMGHMLYDEETIKAELTLQSE